MLQWTKERNNRPRRVDCVFSFNKTLYNKYVNYTIIYFVKYHSPIFAQHKLFNLETKNGSCTFLIGCNHWITTDLFKLNIWGWVFCILGNQLSDGRAPNRKIKPNLFDTVNYFVPFLSQILPRSYRVGL